MNSGIPLSFFRFLPAAWSLFFFKNIFIVFSKYFYISQVSPCSSPSCTPRKRRIKREPMRGPESADDTRFSGLWLQPFNIFRFLSHFAFSNSFSLFIQASLSNLHRRTARRSALWTSSFITPHPRHRVLLLLIRFQRAKNQRFFFINIRIGLL